MSVVYCSCCENYVDTDYAVEHEEECLSKEEEDV